jgi:hypothetical protein
MDGCGVLLKHVVILGSVTTVAEPAVRALQEAVRDGPSWSELAACLPMSAVSPPSSPAAAQLHAQVMYLDRVHRPLVDHPAVRLRHRLGDCG